MRRDDSVFFFTLIDFLLTSLFFGVVLTVVGQASAQGPNSERAKAAAADSIAKAAGISDLTVLTDELTRLGPLQKALEAVRIVRDAGGADSASKAIRTIRTAGGTDTVLARLTRLAKSEGAGKPYCRLGDGRKDGEAIAKLTATDSTLTFETETPELARILSAIGVRFSDVRSLSLSQFRSTFDRLIAYEPNCLYTVDFFENTRYIDARDAVRGRFYLRIHH